MQGVSFFYAEVQLSSGRDREEYSGKYANQNIN